MPGLGTFTIISTIVLALLVWFFFRTLSKDQLDELQRKRSNCRLAGRADFTQGIERIPVVIAVDDSCFYYENHDMQASLDLRDIEEIEYDDELTTGKPITAGEVMRFRSHGQTFEFIVDPVSAPKWKAILAPRHHGDDALAAV